MLRRGGTIAFYRSEEMLLANTEFSNAVQLLRYFNPEELEGVFIKVDEKILIPGDKLEDAKAFYQRIAELYNESFSETGEAFSNAVLEEKCKELDGVLDSGVMQAIPFDTAKTNTKSSITKVISLVKAFVCCSAYKKFSKEVLDLDVPDRPDPRLMCFSTDGAAASTGSLTIDERVKNFMALNMSTRDERLFKDIFEAVEAIVKNFTAAYTVTALGAVSSL